MAALMYVLLSVGYGLSVWSLARQRRYTAPYDTLTARHQAATSRDRHAARSRRPRAAAA